jgi:hypothetical protein
VWRGVPVTDEALTQCVKMLRRKLGDEAGAPRFIETVPKHGYRFIAPVDWVAEDARPAHSAQPESWAEFRRVGSAGSLGGAAAGLIGGLIYGFACAAPPVGPGAGAASLVLVLTAICLVIGLIAGAGVGFGLAAALRVAPGSWRWSVAGAAAGGLLTGAVVKLIGSDAFSLLLGRAPGNVTGASEGAVIGAGVGIGWLLARRRGGNVSLRRKAGVAGLAGCVAGLAVAALGGRMMAGSLDLVAGRFAGSQLRLNQLGALLGEDGFGPLSRLVTSGLEGGLFTACVVVAAVRAAGCHARPSR